MLPYTTEQLASLVALPVIIILLLWTIIIFHKNRQKWGPYDIPIVCVLALSVLRNLTIVGYTLSIVFYKSDFNTEYCSIVTWIFNSIHTFQASSLTSIAVIGLFSAKLHRKSQSIKNFLNSTHIIYHLFCLTTLCACVGVAAILAQKNGGLGNIFSETFDLNPCYFLPFELDFKFNIFIIVLHTFLALVSFICFLIICFNYYKIKKEGFDYIKKSNSDLSDLSNSNYHGINSNVSENRNYYDTYTIQKGGSDHQNWNGKDTWNNSQFNNSEILSNNSTTVSSTNSKLPCITAKNSQDLQEYEDSTDSNRTGLETIHPVLIVCYLFYHLPIIILCVYPTLIQPWSVAGIAVWLGLVQDLLIPIGLGIVDSRFCCWVSNVYRCTGKHSEEKLPQVGLDGKFRPFGLSSQPQSLEISNPNQNKALQAVEHRFPITNGSLYTSIDGRLPVIHNYRRHKEFRTGTNPKSSQDIQSSNVALHSNYINQRDVNPGQEQEKYQNCSNCETNLCPSHSDLHHLTPQYVHRKLSFLKDSQNNFLANAQGNFASTGEVHPQRCGESTFQALQTQSVVFSPPKRHHMGITALQQSSNLFSENNRQRNFLNISNHRLSQSQESINHLFYNVPNNVSVNKYGEQVCHKSDLDIAGFNITNQLVRNSRHLARTRLSRSEDSLTDLQIENIQDIPIPQKFRDPPPKPIRKSSQTQESGFVFSNQPNPIFNNQEKRVFTQTDNQNYSSSDDDGYTDIPINTYDSLSSCNSITTEANCDFDFFQSNGPKESFNAPVQRTNDFYYQNNNMSSFKPIKSTQDLAKNEEKITKPKQVSNVRITRTNSRRSLENFQAFVEETYVPQPSKNEIKKIEKTDNNITKIVILQRSNSYTTLEERRKRKNKAKKVSRSNSKVSDSDSRLNIEEINNLNRKKIRSVEYLPNRIEIEPKHNFDSFKNSYINGSVKIVGSSIPDLKKVFVTEYI